MSSQPDYAPTGSAAPEIDGPGDAELISAVRAGDLEAYGTLFARHADAARRLARQLVSAGDVDDLVSEAFSKVLGVLQRGGGPDLAFRAYLLTSMRRLHVDKLRASSRLTTTDDLTPYDPGVPFNDTVVSGFENATAAKAFASLPERWQQVLWHTEVEGQKPADIAPMLGMSANSVSALAYRAREGLRQAFVTMHANDAAEDVCATVRAELGAYIRGGTSRRTSTKIEEHLGECRECTAIYLELTEVNSHLGAILAPALLGAAGAGYLAAAHGVAAKGVLVGIGHWLWHTPAGRATGIGGGAAAAGVAVAVAVAASTGSPAPVVAAPKPPIVSTHTPAPTPVTPPKVTRTNPPIVVTPPPTAPTRVTPPPPKPPIPGPQILTAPVASTAPYGGTATINLIAGISDPAGGLHIVSASASHGTVVSSQASTPVARALFLRARTLPAGSVTYTPAAGWVGVDTIRYTIADRLGRTVSGTVKVTTLAAPGPAAGNFAASATAGVPTTFDVASHVTSKLSYELTSATSTAGATLALSGSTIDYTAPHGFAGTDTVTYTVTNAQGTSSHGAITVTVTRQQENAQLSLTSTAVASQPGNNGQGVGGHATPAYLDLQLALSALPTGFSGDLHLVITGFSGWPAGVPPLPGGCSISTVGTSLTVDCAVTSTGTDGQLLLDHLGFIPGTAGWGATATLTGADYDGTATVSAP